MRIVNDRFAWPRVASEMERMYASVVSTAKGHRPDDATSSRGAGIGSDIEHLPLACPSCHGALRVEASKYSCSDCARQFPIVDGIPLLVSDSAATEHDEIDHLHGSEDASHKAAQAGYFDRAVAEEFEIERPRGTPRFYRFLLGEKFRRATAPIGPHLIGATALTVCGGSGMDAEYLARAGARVVASDLSLGAARRTRERARRHGLEITSIVADVEHLPFRDRAFDLVLVHDGLHHLEQPEVGLKEMARVAGRWISLTEPARAGLTKAAVRAGLALEREEAGNRVARLSPGEVVDILGQAGFRSLVAQRYAMYYRHEPGWVFRAMSVKPAFPAARLAWRLGNRLIGRFGNKLAVLAERESIGAQGGEETDRTPLGSP
jgi:SAM-dependent methyltransferase